MSDVWWGKESTGGGRGRLKRTNSALPPRPELAPPSREEVRRELRARIKEFTPEWTNLRPADAGMALTQLFSEQMESVLERLNRLPDKAFVEFLNLAGIRHLQASPAAALLEFEVSERAPQSVFISRGFQIGAQPAEGPEELVIFETERDLTAAPVKIAKLYVRQDNLFQSVEAQGEGEGAGFFLSGVSPNRAARSSSGSRPRLRRGRPSRSAYVSPRRPERRRR